MNKKTMLSVLIILFLSLFFGGILMNSALSAYLSPAGIILISAAAGIIFGLLLKSFFHALIRIIQKANFTQLILIQICTIISCICGGLISIPIMAIPGWPGKFLPIMAVFISFVLNGLLLSYRKDAFFDLANRLTNGKIQLSEISAHHEKSALLDTSVIIDGRIADIAHCGFIPGTLLVPGFILQELQFIADSEDTQRRQRGRRGLETLANMQKDKDISIQITNLDVPNIREADAKLMHLAMDLECPILTNDYNLNKVAELQGIRILNVNDLTNAVKSILLPGEKLSVSVIQEGKEINQGVGYMEDGTMVVVENGRPFVGQKIDVAVTKILQTAAGRMIFARHEKELGVRR